MTEPSASYQMTLDYEAARKNLQAFAEWYAAHVGDRNEATTRLMLVDRLLFECLAWPKTSVVLEESQGGEYADYTFSAPRRVLVVEAKKEGSYFEIPAGKEKIDYSIPSLCRDYPDIKMAIEQVADYAQRRGIPYAMVSNGSQVIGFVGVRTDGVSPLEGTATVFPSLDFMLRHFLEFWQLFSKAGVEGKNLQLRLLGETKPQPPPKLSATITNYPGIKGRNIFQTDVQILSELVIQDIARSPQLERRFLEECYCQSGAVAKSSLISKSILQARYAALFAPEVAGPTTSPAVTKAGVSAELLAESLSRRPILLIGDVGVGKTTFIRQLITVSAPEVFAAAITFHVDLGSQATMATDLRRFIPDEITRQLRTKYDIDTEDRNFVRGVYNLELQRFARSVYAELKDSDPAAYQKREIEFLIQLISKREDHLCAVLNHVVRGRKKQVIVFLDNCDQRSEQTQQGAFLIAQEMAERWPVTVFVSLRPETFYRSQQVGALSGYHPKAFTISPPRVDLVIEKRLKFALKLTSGEFQIASLPATSRVRLEKLDVIIRVFLHSLRANPALPEFIDNLSAGNVRVALDLVQEFFGSGHVNTQKIVEIFERDARYDIPLHEFLRAVIYGDAYHFHPERSPICNIFDISANDPKEHFLLGALVGLLAGASGPEVQQGFVETGRVYEQLQRNGFTAEQIDTAITRAHRQNLLETSARLIPVAGQRPPEALRATANGVYHVQRLCAMFAYVDAVIVDTPILDPTFRAAIQNVDFIDQRLSRSELFGEYLAREWDCVEKPVIGFDWPQSHASLRDEIKAIKARLGL